MELNPPFSTGEFSLTASGLSASTSYYFRVFARMKTATVYSEEKMFTTRPAAEDMVMDVEGNIYKTVKIGEQTWMADNLKSTMYADKTHIPYVEDNMEWLDFTRESLGFCWYENVLTHGSAEFEEESQTTRFWTSTTNGYGYAWYRGLDYDTAAVNRDYTGVYSGHAVRCVKDE